jgi:hypothetical protein
MTSIVRVRRLIPAVLLVATAYLVLPDRAQAQFGFGGLGGGFGLGFGFNQVPSPTGYLYQNALVQAQRHIDIPSRNVYANNSMSYLNHVRDNGFVDRYSADRRLWPKYGNDTRPQVAAAPPAAPQVPSLPLSSFYNADHVLIWPGDSPLEGELKEKRAVFDRSSEVVLSESKKNGVASMASVTDARNKLLDYGRPALAYTRAHDTPRISDSFHMFLLTLYESLAQAINPEPVAAAAPPATR